MCGSQFIEAPKKTDAGSKLRKKEMQLTESKIRVLFITSNLGIGGLERVIVQLCMHLDKQKFIPAVCCIHFKGDLAAELEKQNIRIFELNSKKKDYLAFLKILPVIEEFKPQIVHTHNINASIDGIIASVIKKVPIRIHTDHARTFPDKTRYMLAEKIISSFINRIIAVTEETRENLIRFEKIDKRKIQVISNGISSIALKTETEIKKKKKEMGLLHFEFLIGTVVRLEVQKGLIHLIRAVPLILQKFPFTGFIIAGRGTQREILEREAEMLGVSRSVNFLGPRLDIGDILNLLDVYVLSSVWEGLPMSLLEAMSCQRPIVATRVGGIPQAIADGESGILVPPASPVHLAQAICKMLENGVLRQRLAVEARRRFEKNFTVATMVQTHQDIYLHYLRKKGII